MTNNTFIAFFFFFANVIIFYFYVHQNKSNEKITWVICRMASFHHITAFQASPLYLWSIVLGKILISGFPHAIGFSRFQLYMVELLLEGWRLDNLELNEIYWNITTVVSHKGQMITKELETFISICFWITIEQKSDCSIIGLNLRSFKNLRRSPINF